MENLNDKRNRLWDEIHSIDSPTYHFFDSISGEKDTLPKENKKRRWSTALVYFIILLIFVFLVWKILENWSQVIKIERTFQPSLLSFSIILLITYFFSLALLWDLITRKIGLKLPFKKALYYWFLSQLGKYVPGKIVSMMGRSYFYKKEGFRMSLTASAFLLEAIAGVISLSLLSVMLIAHDVAREVLYLFPILLLALLFLYPKMVEHIVSLLNRTVGRQPITLRVRMRDWLLLNFLYGLNFFLLAGGAFFFFCKSILDFNEGQILFLIGALGISGVLGMIAFFTPSGFGVREGSLFFLLCKVMPEADAAVISVSSRLWMMCSELILIGIIYSIFHFGDIFSKLAKH